MKYFKLFGTLLLAGSVFCTARMNCMAVQPVGAAERVLALCENVDTNGVYPIYNKESLEAFLKCVASGYEYLDAVLEADIELGESFGKVMDYAGNFDGQGHKISGMNQELFSTLKSGGVIENLIVEVNILSEKEADSGGIVTYNYGRIKNCEVYGTVTDCNYVGGVTAFNLGEIYNCRNFASVTSLETGETWAYKDWMSGYGAGGIAGFCASSEDEDNSGICAILNCDNYGEVTAMSYAGGIVAYLRDKTSGQAPASSVQEMVQNYGFATPSEQWEEESEAEDFAEPDDAVVSTGIREEDGRHYSLMYCRNYGTVTAVNRVDPRTYWYTHAAGICADLSWGDIWGCENLGRVQFDEASPKYSEEGYVYTNCPMAITDNMGFAPTKEHHIVNCVNLKGTIEGTMRHENIMELSEEEILAWENGTYQGDYISNNWKFDLEEAVDICELQPLDVSENEAVGFIDKKNVYVCNEFVISLPDFMEIEEVFVKSENHLDCYALHITIQQESTIEDMDGKEECWIVRKDADVRTASKEAEEANTKDEWRGRYFYEELFGTISPYYYMKISTLNLPFHNCFQEQRVGDERVVVESAIPDSRLYEYMKEGNHMLGNVIAMPLYENMDGEMEAKWIMVFCEKDSNIHPDRSFIHTVESGFYPLKGDDKVHIVKAGDNLWNLAQLYTPDPWNWEVLAERNGIETPDYIEEGSILIIPSLEEN